MNTHTDSIDTLHRVRRMWHWFLVFVLAGMLLGTCADASADDGCTTDSECVQQCWDAGGGDECLDVLGEG